MLALDALGKGRRIEYNQIVLLVVFFLVRYVLALIQLVLALRFLTLLGAFPKNEKNHPIPRAGYFYRMHGLGKAA